MQRLIHKFNYTDVCDKYMIYYMLFPPCLLETYLKYEEWVFNKVDWHFVCTLKAASIDEVVKTISMVPESVFLDIRKTVFV